MMSKERFRLIKIDDYVFQIHDTDNDLYLVAEQICSLLNEQQATIEEYKDFCLNLCKFLIQKDFVDEYREKYGKEYKIITKWW